MEVVTRLEVIGTQPVLYVVGEIDLATLPILRDHLVRAISAHMGGALAVDLDGVTALDDTGLGLLLGAAARARDAGGDIFLVCTSPTLRHRLEHTGMARAVEVRDRITP